MDVKLPSKTPWKIDLQHFSFSRHYFEESWMGNPQTGEGIKMSSLLERGETAHFVSVHQPRRKRGKGKGLFIKKSPYTPRTILKDFKLTSMNIKLLRPEKDWIKDILDPDDFAYLRTPKHIIKTHSVCLCEFNFDTITASYIKNYFVNTK